MHECLYNILQQKLDYIDMYLLMLVNIDNILYLQTFLCMRMCFHDLFYFSSLSNVDGAD